MSVNRIATDARPTAPPVKARRVWAWQCPDCGMMRLSEKSTTHVARCGICHKRFTIDIKEVPA